MNIYEGGSFVVGQKLNGSDGIDCHVIIMEHKKKQRW